MNLSIYQVDAFCKGPFSGNPAAVVPLIEWLPDQQLQQIAEENNLAETAFFVKEEAGFHLRWFTPLVEVALCGHATLATAHVLFTELGFSEQKVSFNCKSGFISVSRNKELLTLDFPTDQLTRVTNAPQALAKGLTVTPKDVFQGRDDWLCILDSEHQVRSLSPDFGILKTLHGRGVLVTAEGDKEYDFVSRGFFPQTGIDEDPATGSAHTSLTPYWSPILRKKSMKACQLSNRKGYFEVTDNGERTLISGKARLYLKGTIYL